MSCTEAISYSNETDIPALTYPYRSLLLQFLQCASENIELYARRKLNLFFPKVSKNAMIDLCHEAEEILSTEPSLIDIQSPCTIVGDIHGHVLDLLRILKYCGVPHDDHMNPKFKIDISPEININIKKTHNFKYIFLGDLIDRGEFSVETITIIFLLKILYPANVYIIRGNHEFDYLAKQCGFFQQVSSLFNNYNNLSRSQNTLTEKLMTLKRDTPGSEVYGAFMSAFSYLPFGVRVDGKMLCIHGGIGPNFTNADILSNVTRPIKEFGVNGIVDTVLWSDPKTSEKKAPQKGQAPNVTNNNITFSEPVILPLRSTTQKSVTFTPADLNLDQSNSFAPSSRGTGYLFSSSALDQFLKASNLDVLVRAHECVIDGCEEQFNGRLITVFSASNYCGFVWNYSAVLSVKPPETVTKNDSPKRSIFNRCEVFKFYPLDYLKRPQPITINISSNLDTFSDSNKNNNNGGGGAGSARVIELSGYYRRYSSDVTKKTPISQLLQTPSLGARSMTARNNNNDQDDSKSGNPILQTVSLHDPHKLAGLKSNVRPSFVRHDATKFRQNQLINKLKRAQTHQPELPAFQLPSVNSQSINEMAPLQQMNKRISPSEIAATSKLRDRPNSEFKP